MEKGNHVDSSRLELYRKTDTNAELYACPSSVTYNMVDGYNKRGEVLFYICAVYEYPYK